jgi:hypothetical protein
LFPKEKWCFSFEEESNNDRKYRPFWNFKWLLCSLSREKCLDWDTIISHAAAEFVPRFGRNYNVILSGTKMYDANIRIFLWQGFQNRLPTAQQLKARSWKGREECVLCGGEEDVDHLFFQCHLAKFVWSFVSEALRWKCFPRDMNELLTIWLHREFGVSYHICLVCFAGLGWALWTTRNKMCIEGRFPYKPLDTVYLAFIIDTEMAHTAAGAGEGHGGIPGVDNSEVHEGIRAAED